MLESKKSPDINTDLNTDVTPVNAPFNPPTESLLHRARLSTRDRELYAGQRADTRSLPKTTRRVSRLGPVCMHVWDFHAMHSRESPTGGDAGTAAQTGS